MTPEPGPELEEQPCRFCKAPSTESGVANITTDTHSGYCVMCEVCGAQGPIKPTEEEAIAAWDGTAVPEGEVALMLYFEAGAQRTVFLEDVEEAFNAMPYVRAVKVL